MVRTGWNINEALTSGLPLKPTGTLHGEVISDFIEALPPIIKCTPELFAAVVAAYAGALAAGARQ